MKQLFSSTFNRKCRLLRPDSNYKQGVSYRPAFFRIKSKISLFFCRTVLRPGFVLLYKCYSVLPTWLFIGRVLNLKMLFYIQKTPFCVRCQLSELITLYLWMNKQMFVVRIIMRILCNSKIFVYTFVCSCSFCIPIDILLILKHDLLAVSI